MELIYSSLSYFVSLLFFFSSLVFLWRKSIKIGNRLPPGPWRLPIIGSLHHLIGGLPHHTLTRLAQSYGPLMYLQLGEIPVVVIASPNIAKQVLRTHDPAFANRPHFTSSNIISYNNKDIVFSQYGDYWRQMRKICTLEFLSAKMVKCFSGIRRDELLGLISSIRSMNGSSVNMTEFFFRFGISVTCRSALGFICKDQDKFITAIKEILLLAGGFDVADLFPSWKLLHKMSGTNSNMINAHQKLDALIEDMLKERIENKAAGNNEFIGDELLVDVLLRMKENAAGLQSSVTNDHVKAVLLDIIIGGTATSTTIIIWALSEMMKNPNIMAKAQSEVRRVFWGKKYYDENELEKLTYVKLVIKETLRLHPPATIISRACREQTDIGGYTIPQKTVVLINVWALARDPGSWHDPESFIPERFENSCIDFTGDQFEFIPFGAGRRSCPGMQFGLANVEIPLAHLLYHFDWKLPGETNPHDLDMTETHGIETAKKKDLYLVPTEYYHL